MKNAVKNVYLVKKRAINALVVLKGIFFIISNVKNTALLEPMFQRKSINV